MTMQEYEKELLEQLSNYKNDAARKRFLTKAIRHTEAIFNEMSEQRAAKRLYLGKLVSAHDWITVRSELQLYRKLLATYTN